MHYHFELGLQHFNFLALAKRLEKVAVKSLSPFSAVDIYTADNTPYGLWEVFSIR